jgi:RimJ/RimL family protein N-acetyltransferase
VKKPRDNDVLLREVTEADLPVFFEQQLDPQATLMAAFPARERAAFMAHWTRIMADPTNILKTILFKGQVAGNIVSWDQDGKREVGYWLGRDFWGRGIATQALAALLDCVTTRPLYAHVAKHNLASQRVLEKCGFKLDGADRTMSGMPGQFGEPVEEFIVRLD